MSGEKTAEVRCTFDSESDAEISSAGEPCSCEGFVRSRAITTW